MELTHRHLAERVANECRCALTTGIHDPVAAATNGSRDLPSTRRLHRVEEGRPRFPHALPELHRRALAPEGLPAVPFQDFKRLLRRNRALALHRHQDATLFHGRTVELGLFLAIARAAQRSGDGPRGPANDRTGR